MLSKYFRNERSSNTSPRNQRNIAPLATVDYSSPPPNDEEETEPPPLPAPRRYSSSVTPSPVWSRMSSAAKKPPHPPVRARSPSPPPPPLAAPLLEMGFSIQAIKKAIRETSKNQSDSIFRACLIGKCTCLTLADL